MKKLPPVKVSILRSRLSKQIATWVFLSIVTIEGVLFVPSYARRQTEELRKLETVSQEVLNGVKTEVMSGMPQQHILKSVRLNESSVIKGIALHDRQGKLVASIGEAPDFSPETFTRPTAAVNEAIADTIAYTPFSTHLNVVRKRSAEGSRYDVAWPSNDNMPYMLAIRHDATVVQRGMQRYAMGVTFLVIIISAFVTLVTLLVLQRIVIRPLLLLRDDLAVVGEAIAFGETPTFASLQRIAQNELGEVSLAFESMYNRIHQEIRDRHQAEASLRAEQEKADRLLLNILPAEIAAQLKDNQQNQGAIAQRFDAVTILFADIVNFTGLAAQTSPTELVCRLNDVFSAFDAIAQRYGLEKIKTIGDAYMVVGGIPTAHENAPAAVMSMAIDMMAFAQSYAMDTHRLCLRIGINTGPVVAGVIGTQKFSYDLWGDAVNIASRMESHGLVNRIQVSEETYLILKESYSFEDRGYLQIKGRGEMRAFLLAEVED